MGTIFTIILLILVGIVLLILEILILPGLIAGIIGALMILGGIWYSFHELGNTAGTIVALSTLTVTLATIYLAFRYNVWRRFSLQQSSDSKIERVDEMDIKIGDQGKALSVLRPMGTAVFNNKKIEVQSLGEMIEANATIEVIEVLTNKLIVKKYKLKNQKKWQVFHYSFWLLQASFCFFYFFILFLLTSG